MTTAKQIAKAKYSRVYRPFGDDARALADEVQGIIDANEDEVGFYQNRF